VLDLDTGVEHCFRIDLETGATAPLQVGANYSPGPAVDAGRCDRSLARFPWPIVRRGKVTSSSPW
jgi:hypothetical protein